MKIIWTCPNKVEVNYICLYFFLALSFFHTWKRIADHLLSHTSEQQNSSSVQCSTSSRKFWLLRNYVILETVSKEFLWNILRVLCTPWHTMTSWCFLAHAQWRAHVHWSDPPTGDDHWWVQVHQQSALCGGLSSSLPLSCWEAREKAFHPSLLWDLSQNRGELPLFDSRRPKREMLPASCRQHMHVPASVHATSIVLWVGESPTGYRKHFHAPWTFSGLEVKGMDGCDSDTHGIHSDSDTHGMNHVGLYAQYATVLLPCYVNW